MAGTVTNNFVVRNFKLNSKINVDRVEKFNMMSKQTVNPMLKIKQQHIF
jgi:hypothetical protein